MAVDKKTRDYKCKIWLPSGRTEIVTINGSTHLTKNFCVWEFTNTLAKEDVKLVLNKQSWDFIKEVQLLRDAYYAKYKSGLNCSSMYRTASFNRSINGSVNSAHLDSRAADFINIPQSRYTFVKNTWKEICKSAGKIGGINYYRDNRVHIDDYEDKFGYKTFKERDYR